MVSKFVLASVELFGVAGLMVAVEKSVNEL